MTTNHTNGNKSVLLEERVAIGKAPPGGRVDRKSKLIRGVKILGFHSRNPGAVLGKDFADMAGYDYDPAAIKEALPLYEGALVNLDHLESKRDGNGMRVPEGSRHVKQRFGKLQNVRVESDGAYADIRYLDNHPLTPMVLEAAEEMPDVFTMSHHAHGEVERCNDRGGNDKRGKVTKINQVHSVDLIAERPGTTTSLFESSSMDDDSAMTSEAAAQSNASTDETAGNSGTPSRGCDSRASFCQEVMAACKSADLDLAGTVFQVLGAILKAAKAAPHVTVKMQTAFTSVETALYNIAAESFGSATAVFSNAEETINSTQSVLTFSTPYLMWPGKSPNVTKKGDEIHLEIDAKAMKTGSSLELSVTNAHG